MHYKRHNLFNNLCNAMAVRDTDMGMDIMANETGELILSKPLMVRKAIVDSGIKMGQNSSSKELAKTLCDNLPKNKNLQSAIAVLVNSRKADAYSHADGSSMDINVAGKPTGTEIETIANHSSTLFSLPAMKDKMLTTLGIKQNQRGMLPGWSPAKKFFTGVALVGAIWGVIILVKRHNKQTATAA